MTIFTLSSSVVKEAVKGIENGKRFEVLIVGNGCTHRGTCCIDEMGDFIISTLKEKEDNLLRMSSYRECEEAFYEEAFYEEDIPWWDPCTNESRIIQNQEAWEEKKKMNEALSFKSITPKQLHCFKPRNRLWGKFRVRRPRRCFKW